MADQNDKTSTSCFQRELQTLKAIFEKSSIDGIRQCIRVKLQEWEKVPLRIAVTGNSGVGKSSLINAIRYLRADDVGGAPVGSTQTTRDIRMYPHPNNDKLQFYDLPGVGTPKFPKDSYLKEINIDQFDFFLLVSAERFTENDVWLGTEITKRKKMYYFIRTKIFINVQNDKNPLCRSEPLGESRIVSDILTETKEDLNQMQVENVQLFLIDNYEPLKYDFNKLLTCLIECFQDVKRSALLFSLNAVSEQMITVKTNELRSRIWQVALTSGVRAIIPFVSFPTVSPTAVAVETQFYFRQLGLCDNMLELEATLTRTDESKLKEIVKKRLRLGDEIDSENISAESIVSWELLSTYQVRRSIAADESKEIFQMLLNTKKNIPTIQSFLEAYNETSIVLNFILDNMQATAMEVKSYILQNQITAEL